MTGASGLEFGMGVLRDGGLGGWAWGESGSGGEDEERLEKPLPLNLGA